MDLWGYDPVVTLRKALQSGAGAAVVSAVVLFAQEQSIPWSLEELKAAAPALAIGAGAAALTGLRNWLKHRGRV